MPERIQLRRTKGWRMPAGAVKVDRTTKWGNPFDFRRSEFCWIALGYGCRGDSAGRLQPSQERTRDGARSIVATQLREEAVASESAPATRQDIIAWASANKVRFADGKVSLSVVNNTRLGFGLPPFRLVAG